MNRKDVLRILSIFLDPYLKFGCQTLFLTLDEKHLRIKTSQEMTEKDVTIRKFNRTDLANGLSFKQWNSLVEEVYTLQERFPGCLD